MVTHHEATAWPADCRHQPAAPTQPHRFATPRWPPKSSRTLRLTAQKPCQPGTLTQVDNLDALAPAAGAQPLLADGVHQPQQLVINELVHRHAPDGQRQVCRRLHPAARRRLGFARLGGRQGGSQRAAAQSAGLRRLWPRGREHGQQQRVWGEAAAPAGKESGRLLGVLGLAALDQEMTLMKRSLQRGWAQPCLLASCTRGSA